MTAKTTTKMVLAAALSVACFTGCDSGSNGGSGNGSGGSGGATGGSGGSGGSPAPDAGVPVVEGPPIANVDSYRAQLASIVCPALESCCRTAGVMVSRQSCQAMLDQQAQPDLMFDPEAAGDCVATMRTRRSCDVLTAPPICNRVFQGSTPLGEACTQDVECAPLEGGDVSCGFDDVCEGELPGALDAECVGTCSRTTVGGLPAKQCSGGSGADPSQPAVYCFTNDGLYCGSDRTCQPLVEVDGACDGSLRCADGLECHRGDGEETAHCRPLPGLGEPCRGECSEGYCAETTPAVCTAFTELGGACDPESFTDPCGPTASCNDGTCAAENPTAFICAALSAGGF